LNEIDAAAGKDAGVQSVVDVVAAAAAAVADDAVE